MREAAHFVDSSLVKEFVLYTNISRTRYEKTHVLGPEATFARPFYILAHSSGLWSGSVSSGVIGSCKRFIFAFYILVTHEVSHICYIMCFQYTQRTPNTSVHIHIRICSCWTNPLNALIILTDNLLSKY